MNQCCIYVKIMAGDPKSSQSRFYFTPEQLASSPSRKCGMDADQELQYRQRAANLIQDMGQRLHVYELGPWCRQKAVKTHVCWCY